MNPIDGEDSYNGGLQIDVSGNSAFYEEIGKYFLAIARLDAGSDPDYHDHFDVLVSEDERTQLNLIFRRE